MQQSEARRLNQVLMVQVALGAVAGLVTLPLGAMAAISALIGASASLLGNGIAAVWAFRDYRAQEPERILMRLYSAEAAKVALILAILGIAFAAVDGLEIPILLGTFFVVQVASPIVAAQLDNPPGQGSGERKQK